MPATETCPVNLQWKGTDACYDFYCPCGGTSTKPDPAGNDDGERTVEEGHGHKDGYFQQEFQCDACGRWWHLPNRMTALPGKFTQDTQPPTYGCADCETGHATATA